MTWVIQSNTGTAKQIATNIIISLDNLASAGTVIRDTGTTVAGNQLAQEAIEFALNGREQIVEVVRHSCENLQRVAEEFEAADREIRDLIDSSPLSLEGK
ncbi:TIGR04197 family type VII secretion effector [Oceanobacillus sp. CFH 90083]|uniref:TIGR04197 family type VII secretion effector n=1 Tax=Oceanobacillus sp. CFH 90083 TaxID=2592336 RepID=UPI00128BCCD2|nr:TIGR04197 family type VII secretion effector [Oceanobacillus sp. CFH 90083]